MQKLIIGNLKMNLLTTVERERYIESLKKELYEKRIVNSKLVLCVPSLHVENFINNLKTQDVAIGAQNLFWEDRGSYTGEISAPMLKDLGSEFVIIGHSERRKFFGETNADANLKIKAALKNNITPIYCVGETKEEREAGNEAQVIAEQIMEAFVDVSSMKASSVVIAYEPIWAVGSDAIPKSDEILQIKILLKKIFEKAYGIAVAEKIKVLYGGSVKAITVKQVCIDPGMDGVLVGRESLIPSELVKILEIINS
ncbi:MAG: triose-phosphate isomerase [bacterium]